MLYLVKDGIENIGCVKNKNGNRVFNTTFHLITFDFKENFGYIEQMDNKEWKLYTILGDKYGEKKYFYLNTLQECINKLSEITNIEKVELINWNEVK